MTHAFNAINARGAVIGAKVMEQIIANNDVDAIRELRQGVIEAYEALIELTASKPDYPAWHAAFIKINRASPFNALDKTGEYAKLADQLEAIDATGYYFEHVMPMMKEGVQAIIAERDNVIGTYDAVIETLIDNRRRGITVVE